MTFAKDFERTQEAADVPIAEALHAERIERGRFRVKTTDTHHIEVLRMAFGFRITECPVDFDRVYDRYWCYQDLALVIAALHLWDAKSAEEPAFWTKAFCGCRNGEHALFCIPPKPGEAHASV